MSNIIKPINPNSAVRVQWTDRFENYSKEREKEIISYIKNKYNVSAVVVDFNATNKPTVGVANIDTGDVENINSPEVQEKIIITWLNDNKVDISLEDIKKLNKRVENHIDDFNEIKDTKWKVKNLTVENFLSYGEAVPFDFEKLKGLTLINGKNFSGKSTVNEALMYLLFNKTSKSKTADEVINRFNGADSAKVEGELVIDGIEYKLVREVIRKYKKDRSSYTTSTDLKFMTKNAQGIYEVIEKEEDRKATDKKLRESIGSLKEFLMTVVCTGESIFDIINAKATERGQLLSRFLGLEIYEKKEEVAKRLYSEWKLNSKIDKYTSSDLQTSIDNNLATITINDNNIIDIKNKLSLLIIDKDKIVTEKQEYLTLYHNDIDINLVNSSEEYFLNKINSINVDIENKKVILEATKKEHKNDLKEFDELLYNTYENDKKTVRQNKSILDNKVLDIQKDISKYENDIRKLESDKQQCKYKIKDIEGDIKVLENDQVKTRALINQLKTGTNCPECGQLLKNVDHTEKINARIAEGMQRKTVIEGKQVEITEINNKIILFNNDIESLNQKIITEKNNIEDVKAKYKDFDDKIEIIDSKMKDLLSVKQLISENDMLQLKIDKYEVELESLNDKLFKEHDSLNKYKADLSKIQKNKELDVKIREKTIEISQKENDERYLNKEITTLEYENQSLIKENENSNILMQTIKKEEHLSKVFLTYISMVGKNGISKTIMKNSIPVLNMELTKLLRDSAEFTVEIDINIKNNEVEFWLVDNETGLKSSIMTGSGYEKTIAALAIRIVNSKINALPKPSLLIVDEIFATVDAENLELIKIFIDKISTNFDNIFLITHNEYVKEWADNIITITKENKVSKVSF